MRNITFLRRVYLWLFATAVFVGANEALAQPPPPEADHLKCYQVRKDTNPKEEKIVALFNEQFRDEQCKLVTKAQLLCAPTIKNNGNDELGGPIPAKDYLCYLVKCTPRDNTTHGVIDQFNAVDPRLVIVGDARWLCAPAEKDTLSQPRDCGQSAPLCSGECPPGQKCRALATGAACQCLD